MNYETFYDKVVAHLGGDTPDNLATRSVLKDAIAKARERDGDNITIHTVMTVLDELEFEPTALIWADDAAAWFDTHRLDIARDATFPGWVAAHPESTRWLICGDRQQKAKAATWYYSLTCIRLAALIYDAF